MIELLIFVLFALWLWETHPFGNGNLCQRTIRLYAGLLCSIIIGIYLMLQGSIYSLVNMMVISLFCVLTLYELMHAKSNPWKIMRLWAEYTFAFLWVCFVGLRIT